MAVNDFFRPFLAQYLVFYYAKDHISVIKNKGAKRPLIYNVYAINYPRITIPVITSAITA